MTNLMLSITLVIPKIIRDTANHICGEPTAINIPT